MSDEVRHAGGLRVQRFRFGSTVTIAGLDDIATGCVPNEVPTFSVLSLKTTGKRYQIAELMPQFETGATRICPETTGVDARAGAAGSTVTTRYTPYVPDVRAGTTAESTMLDMQQASGGVVATVCQVGDPLPAYGIAPRSMRYDMPLWVNPQKIDTFGNEKSSTWMPVGATGAGPVAPPVVAVPPVPPAPVPPVVPPAASDGAGPLALIVDATGCEPALRPMTPEESNAPTR